MLIVIIESYEPLEFGKRRSTSTKVLTDELYTPDEVDVKWYARMKTELKERQNRRIKEGTMVETEFKVRVRCSSCEIGTTRWEIQKKRRCGQTDVSS